MDQRVIYFLSAQLVLQGEIMASAKREYSDAVNGLGDDSTLQDYARVLLAVQSILTSAAMVSKILWKSSPPLRPVGCTCPQDPKGQQLHAIAVENRKVLRETLGIKGEKYTILESRKVRNAIEHIDERIETYFAANPPISPDDPEFFWLQRRARDPKHFLGMLFHEQNVFWMLGDKVEYMKLPDVVAEVSQSARSWIEGQGLPPYYPMMV